MRLTIDTRVDSKEDIRKAISFLSSLDKRDYSDVEKQPANIFDNPSPSMNSDNSSIQPAQSSSSSFMSMFGSSETPAAQAQETPIYQEPSSVEDEEEPAYDKRIRIIPY
jgi:hypothetical protein